MQIINIKKSYKTIIYGYLEVASLSTKSPSAAVRRSLEYPVFSAD